MHAWSKPNIMACVTYHFVSRGNKRSVVIVDNNNSYFSQSHSFVTVAYNTIQYYTIQYHFISPPLSVS